MNLPVPKKIMENPVGALSRLYRAPDVTVQPYMFGDNASKRTCFWMQGLPGMVIPPKTEWHPGRMAGHKGKQVQRWANQTDSGQNRLSPGENRWNERSETYPGIALAIAKLFDE